MTVLFLGSFLTLFFLSESVFGKNEQPTSLNGIGGGGSFCVNSKVTLSIQISSTQTCGTGNSASTVTVKFYSNSSLSNNGGTLVYTENYDVVYGNYDKSISYVFDAESTKYYYAVVNFTNSGNCSNAGSLKTSINQMALVTVIPANNITAPSVTTFCATSASSDITMIGSDMGSGASYQWQVCTNPNNNDDGCYADISGATSKDYNPGTITNSNRYRRKVGGACASASNIIGFVITPAISNNTISPQATLSNCGSITEYWINGSYPSGGKDNIFTFQWQSSTDGVNFSNNSATAQGWAPGLITSPIYYRRIAYSGNCTSYSNVLFYNTKAAEISGSLTVNVGSTTELTGSPPGGTWSSGTTSVATVNSSGLVSGVSGGTSIITYTTTNGCINSVTVSVTGAACTSVGITSATAAASPICSNATTTLTANGAVGTNALVTWWSGFGGTGTNYGTGLTLPNASPGNYYARVTGDCGAPVEALVTVVSSPNASIGSVFGTSQLCIGETTTYSANTVVLGGGTGAWSTSDETIATVDVSGLVTGVANGSCDIIYTITDGCGGTQTAKQSLTVESPGNPAVFGSDQWNVYVYNGTNSNLSSNTYRGYYSDSNLSFDTRNMWLANSTPSSANGYQGCYVDKLMTFVYKRKGFPCGLYTISVGHDDDASILVNDVQVWTASGWTYTPATAWTGFLDENATLEFRVRNTGGGDAYGQLSFSSSSNLTITPVVNSLICSSSNSISGTSEANATIVAYSGGTQIGTTMSNSSGQWSVPVSSLSAGDNITATAKVDNKCLSNVSSSVLVVPTNTFNLSSSAPSLCINTSLNPITIATTGATGIGTPIGLPSGVTASWNSNQITLSGTPTTSGTFNYTIPLTGGCGAVSATGMITVNVLPIAYTVTGSGTYCLAGTVGLSGSEAGVNYQLYNGATKVGSPVSGTGDAISFGNQQAGTYTVVATISNGDCPAQMTGSAVVTIGDTEKPTITQCLPNGTADCVKNIPVAINTIQGFIDAGGVVTDNCMASMTVSYDDVIVPGSSCKVNRTYTITDASGNKATCTQVFTITDLTKPVISCNDDLVSSPNTSGCAATLDITAPTAISDECSLVNVYPSYNYRLGDNAASDLVTGTGSFTATFPEGITTINWTITDLCGNTSKPCAQIVQVGFSPAAISYDNGSTANGLGSGVQPMQTSTHNYFVDNKKPESGYTYSWGLFVNNGGVPGVAVDPSFYSITKVNLADVQVTFKNTNSIPEGNYIVSVIKTQMATTCQKQTKLPITVQSNSSFDVAIDNLGNQCQAPGGNLTTISWNVTFPNVITEPFMFSYSIKLGGTVVASGNVANITYAGAIPMSGLSAGAQTSKSANSRAIVIYYSLYGVSGNDLARTVEIEINATDAYQVSEPNRTNNIDDLMINQVPVITFE